MEDAQFIIKESYTKRRYHQLKVNSLMLFQDNERQLDKNNNEKVFNHLQTKYFQKDINTK